MIKRNLKKLQLISIKIHTLDHPVLFSAKKNIENNPVNQENTSASPLSFHSGFL